MHLRHCEHMYRDMAIDDFTPHQVRYYNLSLFSSASIVHSLLSYIRKSFHGVIPLV